MNSDLTYADKIGVMLMELPFEFPFVLSQKVAPENQPAFITCVKNYIDKELGWKEKWEIIFASDWTSLKKIERA